MGTGGPRGISYLGSYNRYGIYHVGDGNARRGLADYPLARRRGIGGHGGAQGRLAVPRGLGRGARQYELHNQGRFYYINYFVV